MDETAMRQAIMQLQVDVNRAQHTAESAVNGISAHENICLLRYENINTKLDVLPTIFGKMEVMANKINLATGVWIGVLGIGSVVLLMSGIMHLSTAH
jgi:hypothetical protein